MPSICESEKKYFAYGQMKLTNVILLVSNGYETYEGEKSN